MLDAALHFIWPDGMSNFSLMGDDIERLPFLDHTRFVRATADGYVAVMPVKAAEWEGALKALNLATLWEDERFATPVARAENSEQLQKLLNEAYATFSTDDVCNRLEAHDVPYARINSRESVIDDPQILAMGALQEFNHRQGGLMRQPRPTAQFHGTPSSLHRGSPELGEHTDEILLELGRSVQQIEELKTSAIINSH
jgi:crotonobetainyl-CoA:carnitine CoA-transferase CaiB-like acyl-CoA transferase